MNIRVANRDEWRKVRDLYLSLLKSDPQAFADEYDEIANHSDLEWTAGINNEDGRVFIAEEGGKMVGMGRVNFYKEAPGVSVLHKLGVLPEYRNKGMAKKLVEVREEWAKSKGSNKARLYVIANRDKVIEFSMKNGYKIIETLPNNVQRKDGTLVDVLVMEKDL